MTLTVRRLTQSFAILLLAGLVPLGVLANKLPTKGSRRPTSVCKCNCTHGKAKGECPRLCGLLEYEGHSRAATCHKAPASGPQKGPASHPHPSGDDDGPEMARR